MIGFGLMMVISCDLNDNDQPLPFYLDMDDVTVSEPYSTLEGTHKITDAWVFADGQIQGVYPLPVKAPLFWEDKPSEIKILAGIRNSGMNDYPVFYPFFKEISLNMTPEALKEYKVPMNFKYIDDAKFSVIEDFENGNIFNFDLDGRPETVMEVTTEESRTGERCGVVTLTRSVNFMEIGCDRQILKGQNARGKSFVEFDYKGEGEIALGIAKTNRGIITIKYILFVPAKKEWNHIYVDYTNEISPEDFESYRLALAFTKTGSSEESKVYIDNYKHVHF